MKRAAKVERKTKETAISIEWAMDGKGMYVILTDIPFFDHILSLFTKHGFFDLRVRAKGDIDVDYHHTVEDIGIVMGQAFTKACLGYEGIKVARGTRLFPWTDRYMLFTVDVGGKPTFFEKESSMVKQANLTLMW